MNENSVDFKKYPRVEQEWEPDPKSQRTDITGELHVPRTIP